MLTLKNVVEWCKQWFACVTDLSNRVSALEQEISQMSAEMDKVQADYESLKKLFTDGVSSLLSQVAALKQQLATAPNDTAALQTLANEMEADATALNNQLNPPTPPAA